MDAGRLLGGRSGQVVVSAYGTVLRIHTNTCIRRYDFEMCVSEVIFFRIVEAVSVREVYCLWFVVDWNSDLRLPCSNVNLGKQTYFQKMRCPSTLLFLKIDHLLY